jgi:outer membrane receptor for ferrienterochelin and colicin/copper chaperone CopZ
MINKKRIITTLVSLLFLVGQILAQSTETIEFQVMGTCGMCEDRVEEAAMIEGVTESEWDWEKMIMTVTYDPAVANIINVHKAIAKIGHDTDLMKAGDNVYSALPDCCLYRDILDIPFVAGRVQEENANGELIPLIGTNVYWLGTFIGTATDANGDFKLDRTGQSDKLIVSYIGYQNDTIAVREEHYVRVRLSSAVTLDEVQVVHRKKSTEISFLDPIKVRQIGERELRKAACCNLSESFETTPSVDVAFTDAITGTRQIQMLGLAGPYSQITRENMPDVRGLSVNYGLTYVPGTWVDGINLSKGTGSVVNGYESIAGQIDVKLKCPVSMERLYLNAYSNAGGRIELNANLKTDIGNKWGTSLLLHTKQLNKENDRNKDNFIDHPLGEQYIVLNRWDLYSANGVIFQLGLKGTYIDDVGGEIGYDKNNEGPADLWGMNLNTQRLESWMKLGKVSLESPWRSVGFQLSGAYHKQDSYFGNNVYDANQKSLYANLIYQSIFSNTNHVFKTGISVQHDEYDEKLNLLNFDYTETVPGVFFEYTHKILDKFNFVAGMRADYSNQYDLFVTPRLHLRYALSDNTVLRTSIGRGQKTANILAENNRLFATGRSIEIIGDNSDKPFGLEAESAWNYGINFTHNFNIAANAGTISADFYRTDFQNQIVIDLDHSPQKALFYNLEGDSYANSFQVQLDYALLEKLDLRLAYRWHDVQTTYSGVKNQKPLISTHRAFINLGYETANQWKFDYTLNWQGDKRIPFTGSNPLEYQLEERSPDFFLMNFQVSKLWGDRFEWYLGMENVLDYKQENPILASDQPFSEYFDSSLVWGPIFGRNTYVGVRYRIQ